MPILGFGVFQIPDAAECERCVLDAIGAGYRSIDTAQIYGNEEAVGRAAEKSGVPREELFLTTKVWITNGGYEKAKASIDESLRKLRTDYVDLLLIHQPFNDYYGTYRAMEEANRAGKVRAIGVSNFYPDRFVDLAEFCEIKPAVNQVEFNPFFQQRELRSVMAQEKTKLEAYFPLGHGSTALLTHPVVTALGEKYRKTAGQILLRFEVQEGCIVLPKSTNPQHMAENLEIFDFALTPEEMDQLHALDTGKGSHNPDAPGVAEMLLSAYDVHA